MKVSVTFPKNVSARTSVVMRSEAEGSLL